MRCCRGHSVSLSGDFLTFSARFSVCSTAVSISVERFILARILFSSRQLWCGVQGCIFLGWPRCICCRPAGCLLFLPWQPARWKENGRDFDRFASCRNEVRGWRVGVIMEAWLYRTHSHAIALVRPHRIARVSHSMIFKNALMDQYVCSLRTDTIKRVIACSHG